MREELAKTNPLENKKWLFPETGQGGFHYNDVKNAVAGLEIELMKNYDGENKDQILQLVERWFPDVSSELKTQIFQGKQNTIF